MHRQAYEQVEVYRKRAGHLPNLVRQICPGGRVLGLGCGDGLFAHLFALNGAEVVGTAPESGAIEQAETGIATRDYPSAQPRPSAQSRLLVGSAEQLALPDRSVDAVVMTDVIEHLPNPVAALRQAERVPTPGGVLLDPHGSTATGRTPFTTPPSTPWTSWSARFTMPRTWWSATGARSRASIASWSSWHTSRGGDRPCPPGPAPARPCTAGPHPL